MARQRFIWPAIWDDPDMGRLDADSRLLYIGCFSLADDDGRILGDPVYLKTQVFRYRPTTPAQVKRMRDALAEVCKSFRVYEVSGTVYIAFLNWGEFQHPKYPTPSKLPPPPGVRKRRKPAPSSQKASGSDSGNGSPSHSGSDSSAIPPRVGLGLEEQEPKAVTSTYNPEQNGPRSHEIEELKAQTTASLRSI